MMAGVVLAAAYLIYARESGAPETDDLRVWAVAMLILIGIGVASQIVIQIIFHIVYCVSIAVRETGMDDKEVERIVSSEMVDDEMDKLISLKSEHIGYVLVGVGFIAALIVIAVGHLVVYALHVLFGSFLVGSVAEGCVMVYLYERGVRNRWETGHHEQYPSPSFLCR
jgi:4-amino-4-deoxy-L-arabinose transferase-like glycosyltransferase